MWSLVGPSDMGDLFKKWKKEGKDGEWTGVKWMDGSNISITAEP